MGTRRSAQPPSSGYITNRFPSRVLRAVSWSRYSSTDPCWSAVHLWQTPLPSCFEVNQNVTGSCRFWHRRRRTSSRNRNAPSWSSTIFWPSSYDTSGPKGMNPSLFQSLARLCPWNGKVLKHISRQATRRIANIIRKASRRRKKTGLFFRSIGLSRI